MIRWACCVALGLASLGTAGCKSTSEVGDPWSYTAVARQGPVEFFVRSREGAEGVVFDLLGARIVAGRDARLRDVRFEFLSEDERGARTGIGIPAHGDANHGRYLTLGSLMGPISAKPLWLSATASLSDGRVVEEVWLVR